MRKAWEMAEFLRPMGGPDTITCCMTCVKAGELMFWKGLQGPFAFVASTRTYPLLRYSSNTTAVVHLAYSFGPIVF